MWISECVPERQNNSNKSARTRDQSKDESIFNGLSRQMVLDPFSTLEESDVPEGPW